MNLKITKNVLLAIQIILYCFLIKNQYIYHMNYDKCLIYMILTSIFIYLYGMYSNKEKDYQINVTSYISLFLILLFSFTFFLGRAQIHFYSWWYSGQYQLFYTIYSQIHHASILSILKNIIGNSIMLIPMSILLMIKSKSYQNIFKQSLIILPMTIGIELLQAFTHTGVFDVDDIFLNYVGSILFTILITRFDIIGKIRKLFFTDFHLSNKIKTSLLYISMISLLILDMIILIK